MKRTPMPPRTSPMPRTRHLRVIEGDGAVIVPFPDQPIPASTRRLAAAILHDATPPRRAPLPKVSKKRARVNRERTAMADRRWPDRREGTVMCVVPGCGQPADDLHETLTRARGGDITDPRVCVPVCRAHHDWIHTHETEATALGLLKHSWDGGDAA